MGLTFPIILTGMETSKKSFLFHSMDFASSGKDMDELVVYFTAYDNRVDLAQQLIAVLPAFIYYYLGDRSIVKKWFHPGCIHMCDEVEFHEDSSGKWLGTWTTQEDEINQEIFDEDLGIELHLDGLELLAQDINKKHTITSEELSFKSFKTALGGRMTDDELSASARDGEDTSLDQASAAPNGGGGMS